MTLTVYGGRNDSTSNLGGASAGDGSTGNNSTGSTGTGSNNTGNSSTGNSSTGTSGNGSTANAIGPGPIRTELFERANPPGSLRTQAIVNGVPVKRLGEPEDVAQAVGFFLDARSGFVTGQTLYVCGGLTVGVAPV